MRHSHSPKAGDVFIADLEPVQGSEQGRRRPVIVFQASDLSQYTTTFLCVPLTTNLERLDIPGTCLIHKGDGGLAADSIALGYQLRALDRTRFKKKIGTLAEDTLELLADAILDALGIAFP